jgi:phosphatidylserine decarboxylase
LINCQVTSPTVAKSLNPSWESLGAGEAKLEAKVYDSRNLGRQPVEIIIWDKDRVGKEYLGEVNLGLHDWWGPRSSWHDNAPPIGFSDDDNKVSSHLETSLNPFHLL